MEAEMLKRFIAGTALCAFMVAGCETIDTGIAVHNKDDPRWANVEGLPKGVKSQEDIDRLNARTAAAQKCLFSVTEIDSRVNDNLVVVVGPDKAGSREPSAVFRTTVQPNERMIRRSYGDGSKSDPDVYANPGNDVQAAVYRNGRLERVIYVATMGQGCASHPDPNKRFFSVYLTITEDRAGRIQIGKTVDFHTR